MVLFLSTESITTSENIGKNHSEWSQLNGAMPQGSRLGPLSFLVLIDDLEVGCLVHKFVSNTTLTELLDDRTKQSNMQSCFDRLLTWSDKNGMAVKFNKTKDGSTLPNIQPPTHPHHYWPY